jgi:phage baseplate assembly protein W
MAIVPTVSGPSVLPNAPGPVYQNASGATPDAFGAAGGRALEQAGATLERVSDRLGNLALQQQRDENVKALKEADAEFRNGLLAIQYGDGTPENPGFFGLQGDNAVNATKDYQDRITKLRDQVSTKLGNDAVRREFGVDADKTTGEVTARMSRHVTGERVKSQIATSEARLQVAVREAAAGFNDPQVLATSLATARGEALSQAQLQGSSPEVTIALVRNAESAVISAAVLNAVDKDPALADKILNDNAGRMTADAALKVRKVVDQQFLEVKSQQVADFYYAQVKSGKMNEEQAREAIRREYSGKEETAAMRELDGRINDLYRFEASLRARESADRARQNERDAEALRAAADTRRAAKDALAAEDRQLRLDRQKADDERKKEKDEIDKLDREAKEKRQEAATARADRREGREVERLEAAALEREERIANLRAQDARREAGFAARERSADERRQRLLAEDAEQARKSQLTEDVTAVAQTITDQGGTLEQRIKKARELFAGELRTRAERLVSEFYARDRRIAQETRATEMQDVTEQIEAGQVRFDSLPPEFKAGLTPTERRNLQEIDRRVALGIPNTSEPGLVGQLYQMMDARQVDEFLAIPIDEMRSKLSEADYKTFISMRDKASSGRLDPNVSADAAFVIGKIGGFAEFQGPKKADDRNRLVEVVMAEVNALRAEKRGQRITDAERSEIVNQAVATYLTTKPKTPWYSNTPTGEVSAEENKAIVSAARQSGPRIAIGRAMQTLGIEPDPKAFDEIAAVRVPAEARPQVIAAWRRNFGANQTPTDTQIKALYWKATRGAQQQ